MKKAAFFVVNLFDTISVFKTSTDGLDGETEISVISQIFGINTFC